MKTANGRKISRDERNFVRMHAAIMCGFADTFIRDGTLNPTTKEPAEILHELRLILRKRDLQEPDITFTIDHTGDLLTEAARYRSSNDHLLVSVFLATWVEHFVNRIMRTLALRKALSDQDTETLIRDMSLKAKFILCHVLCENPTPTIQLNRLQKVSEFRNYFLHYKWRAQNERFSDDVKKANRACHFLVRYLRTFEERYVLRVSTADLKALEKLIEHEAIETRFYERFHADIPRFAKEATPK